MNISVIVNSRDEGEWLRETVDGLEATLPDDCEIVVVDDGSEDGSSDFLRRPRKRARRLRNRVAVGMPRARNQGARRSTGRYLVFCDAHMRYEKDWWRPLLAVLDRARAGASASIVGSTDEDDQGTFGYGFTLADAGMTPQWLPPQTGRAPFRAPFLPGCCLAMKREVFEKTGGYDEGLRGRGCVDAEIGIRFWLLGYENWMVPASRVWHHFREIAPYRVPHTDAIHNRLRTALVHFETWRVSTVFSALRGDACVGPAVVQLLAGDTLDRRHEMMAKRVRGDDWFCKRFGMQW